MVLQAFSDHCRELKRLDKATRRAAEPVCIVHDSAWVTEATPGAPLPSEKMRGDTNLRTLRSLLCKIDESGYDRSQHQRQFHDAFERACARVLYRGDWELAECEIKRRNGWLSASPTVLVSTPRRFGKTFSIAQFAACLAYTMGLEIVVFSPARRASRKMLERILQFLNVLDATITENNLESCRLNSLDGGTALIRSFPSRVSVC